MNGLEEIGEMLPLLLPLILINVALIAVALYDLFKRKRVKGGNKILWGIFIVLIEFIGPIVYLLFGREED